MLADFLTLPPMRRLGTTFTASWGLASRLSSRVSPCPPLTCIAVGKPACSAIAGYLAIADCFVAGYRVASIESFDF